jgi:hypothetical protein
MISCVAPAVAVALTDRVAALADWDVQNISATRELREQIREALNRAVVTNRKA